MEVTTTSASPEAAVVTVVGSVYSDSYEAFQAAGIAALDGLADGGLLTLDLALTAYLCSRALRALTQMLRHAGGKKEIVLARPSEQLREILEISRYDKLFKVVD